MAALRLPVLVMAIVLAGCGGEEGPRAAPRPPADAGPEGCAPAEEPLEGGACQPAGVVSCAPGFEADDRAGCRAILPAQSCPKGSMAVPGEMRCHEVAPCGASKWGEGAPPPGALYVDAGYVGGSGDGTEAKPFTTISAAVASAADGASIVVAAGSYLEHVEVTAPVHVRGRCPSMVDIVGPMGASTAITVSGGADGATIEDLAVRGDGYGIALTGVRGVSLERVWIHDNDGPGIYLDDTFGTAELAVRGALIEATRDFGAIVIGVSATFEGTVVRDVQEGSSAKGRGIEVHVAPGSGARANLAFRGSLLERAREVGVYVGGSDAVIDGSVVRETRVATGGAIGRGMGVEYDEDGGGQRGNVTIQGSLFEQNRDTGLFVSASDATIASTVVRDTAPGPSGLRGVGVDVENGLQGVQRGRLTLVESLVERNQEAGVYIGGADGTIDATVVRETQPSAQGAGRGIAVQYPGAGDRAVLGIRWCLVERNHEVGILVSGGDATIDACLVRETQPAPDQKFGMGIDVQADPVTAAPASADIHASWIEASHDFGVLVSDASARLDGVVVRGTVARSDGLFGDGLAVAMKLAVDAETIVTGSRIEGCTRAGVSVFGGKVSLGSSTLECNPISLDAETYSDNVPSFVDLGQNTCGCAGATSSCKAVSSNLEPPAPLGP